jgi:hypothetical protein
MKHYEKIRLVDYVVDGGDGEEELYNTKREAVRAAQRLAKEQRRPISVYRWSRPTRDDDMELDEGFRLTVAFIPNNKKGEKK